MASTGAQMAGQTVTEFGIGDEGSRRFLMLTRPPLRTSAGRIEALDPADGLIAEVSNGRRIAAALFSVVAILALALAATTLLALGASAQTSGDGVKGWGTPICGEGHSVGGLGSASIACERQWSSCNNQGTKILDPTTIINSDSAQCHWHCNVGQCLPPPGRVGFECLPGYAPSFFGRCIKTGAPTTELPVGCEAMQGGQPSLSTPSPIAILTGAKIFQKEDFATADGRLAIRRNYRSFNQIQRVVFNGPPRGVGINWRLDFSYELHISGLFYQGDGVSVHLPDGSAYTYRRAADGSMTADYEQYNRPTRNPNTLAFVGTWPADLRDVQSTPTEWDFTDRNGTVWRLKTSAANYFVAQVIRKTTREGYVIDFAYGALGELISATDTFGKQLTFTWNTMPSGSETIAASISRVDLPDSTYLIFSYDGALDGMMLGPVRLLRVQHFSASNVQLDSTKYLYNDARFPYHITNVVNADNVVLNAVTYDGQGRAISSALPGNIRDQVEYGERANITTRTVTNRLGKKTVYKYDGFFNTFRFLGIDGEPSANCPASATSVIYDSGGNGFVVSSTDEEGRITAYTRDPRGNPLTITRGAGTPDAVTTSFAWHPTLYVPTQITEPGRTTNLAWVNGRLTVALQIDTTSQTVPYSTNGQQRRWIYGYTGSLLTSVDGPLEGPEDKTLYAYGADGYLRSVTNPIGQVTTVTAVNGRGQPTSITDPNDAITAVGYDQLGRVTSLTSNPGPSEAVTTFTYDTNSNLSSITRPGSGTLSFAYDNALRLTSITNAAGESITYTRNAMGGATKIVVKRGATITAQRTQAFDELGRLIRTIGAESAQTWTFGYDKTDNLTAVVDPRSQAWSSGFDALNRLISESDPGGAIVNLARNGQDEVASYTDPRSLTTTYVRSGFGQVIRETNPDSGITDYVYDSRGLLTQSTDARGIVTQFAYDLAGRMTSKTFPALAAENVTVTWDGTAGGNKGKGRVTRIVDQAGASDFKYDARGNVLSETRTIAGTAYPVAYAYDLADRLISVTYPSGRIVNYVRDNMGRVTSVTSKENASAPVVTLASDVVWRPMAGTDAAGAAPDTPDLGTGVQARNAWPVTDGSGMNAGTAAQISALPGTEALTTDVLQSLTYGNGFVFWKNFTQDNELYQSLVEDSSTTVMNRGLARSDKTNVTQNWDAVDATETQHFSYSPAGRLSGATGAYGTRSWIYDGVGNRLTETANGTTTEWLYPANSNRLQSVKQGATTLRSFAYYPEGSASQDVRGATTTVYGLRQAGTLSSVTVGGVGQATYLNDAFRRLRVRNLLAGSPTPGTTHYVWDIFGHIIGEHVVGTGVAREYVWLGDMPLAAVDASATPKKLHYVHVDHLDRPALMTDAAKAVVWKASYEPFGAVRSIIGSASLDLRFPGQWFQLESGLAYNWNRHYDPSLGRYVQPDPLGFVDGPSLYGYAEQSPMMGVDPSGRWAPQVVGALVGGTAGGLVSYIEWRARCPQSTKPDWDDIALSAAIGAAAGAMSPVRSVGAAASALFTAYFGGAAMGFSRGAADPCSCDD